jgi:hypothetical protein
MFIESIIKIYKGHEKESNGFGSSLLIVIILLVIFYFYLKVSQSQVLLDWKNQKCNPKYMFFSYYMNPVEGQDPYTSTKNNFIQCMKPIVSIFKTNTYKDLKNTTKNIGRNTEDLAKYVEIINKDMDHKIDNWSEEYKILRHKQQSLAKESNERYYKEKDMFETIRIYAQRLHDVLYSITFFVKNKLLFEISENKRNFKIKNFKGKRYNVNQLGIDQLRYEMYQEYLSICNGQYSSAFNELKSRRAMKDFDPQKTDFSKSINLGYDAIQRFQDMIDMLDKFNIQNNPDDDKNSLLKDTMYKCSQVKKFNVSCNEIFPNWELPQNTST